MDISDVFAALFGPTHEEIDAWEEANPAKFSIGDTVKVVDSAIINNPETTLTGTFDGALGTVVSDDGLIPPLGERGYVVRFEDVTWDHPAAPADLARDSFALLESEIAAA